MRVKRKYELRKRAEEMAGTRQRITEAAAALHGTVGPARTTMSAVARRAGVQRGTLYRHFPTEAALFEACSSHFFSMHAPPDPGAWRAIDDPHRRLTRALEDVYAYYEQTEAMFSNVLRDADLMDSLQTTMEPFEAYLAEAAGYLLPGWPTRGRRRQLLATVIRQALDFCMWRLLAGSTSITRAEAVELATALVEAAAMPASRSERQSA
jgi:AcrR family transcriptional regulator